MNEKQFDYEDEYITRNGGVIFIAKTVNDAEMISKTFNQLIEENEQLKQEIEELENEIEMLEGKLWNCKHFR